MPTCFRRVFRLEVVSLMTVPTTWFTALKMSPMRPGAGVGAAAAEEASKAVVMAM